MRRKLRVGDKVRVVESHAYCDSFGPGAEGVIVEEWDGGYLLELTLGGHRSRVERSYYAGNRPISAYRASELVLIEPAPESTPTLTFAPPSPNIAIGDDVVEDIVERMVSDMKAHISAGGARGDDIRRIGDICVVVTPTRVYKYRLEGVSDYEA